MPPTHRRSGLTRKTARVARVKVLGSALKREGADTTNSPASGGVRTGGHVSDTMCDPSDREPV